MMISSVADSMRTVDTSAKRSTRTVPRIAVLEAEHLAAVADQSLAWPVDEPQVAAFGIEADRIDDVGLSADDALVAPGDDLAGLRRDPPVR